MGARAALPIWMYFMKAAQCTLSELKRAELSIGDFATMMPDSN
jgi:hypothetical protein